MICWELVLSQEWPHVSCKPLSQGKVPFSVQTGSRAGLSPQPYQAARDNRVFMVWEGRAVRDGTVSPGKGEAAGHY